LILKKLLKHSEGRKFLYLHVHIRSTILLLGIYIYTLVQCINIIQYVLQ